LLKTGHENSRLSKKKSIAKDRGVAITCTHGNERGKDRTSCKKSQGHWKERGARKRMHIRLKEKPRGRKYYNQKNGLTLK